MIVTLKYKNPPLRTRLLLFKGCRDIRVLWAREFNVKLDERNSRQVEEFLAKSPAPRCNAKSQMPNPEL